MEAVASGIAVASLAIQLIDITRYLCNFFKDVTGIPEEIRRFTLDLDQLTDMLRDLCVLTSIQEAHDEAPRPLSSLLSSLQNCKDRLVKMQDIVDAAARKLLSSGRLSKHWEAFKIAFKKNDLERLERQLHGAMQLLTMAMTMNLMAVNLTSIRHTSSLVKVVNRNLLISNTSVKTARTSSPVRQGPLPQRTRKFVRQSTQKRCALLLAKGPLSCQFTALGKVTVNSKGEDSQYWFLKEVSVTLSSRILGYYISLCLRNSYGSISQRFRVEPVLDSSAPIFRLCQDGRIEDILTEFSSGNISPFVTDPHGWTLLHVESTAKFDTIKALIVHGQVDVTTYLKWDIRDNSGSYLWVINQEEFEMDIVPMGDILYRSMATQVSWYLEEMMLEPVKDLLLKWTSIIQRLLKLGLSPSPMAVGSGTPLDILFSSKHDEIDSCPIGDKWLMTLSLAGVDIESYFETEKLLHSSGFLVQLAEGRSDWTEGVQRRLLFERVEELDRYMIRWEWFHDEKASTSLLPQEFRALSTHSHSSWTHSQCWKCHWPFKCPDDWVSGSAKGKTKRVRMRGAAAQSGKLNQHKLKVRGLPKFKIFNRNHRVPGAWVEDGTFSSLDYYYQDIIRIVGMCLYPIIVMKFLLSFGGFAYDKVWVKGYGKKCFDCVI